MKTYRVTLYREMTEKKRRINVEANNIQNAINVVEYTRMNHVVDEIIKVERWDDRK